MAGVGVVARCVHDRLVVYLFKRTGRREFYAVKKAIGSRHIEFALLHVTISR